MIKISNLSKKFDHRGIAGIHELNLVLNPGDILSIMGPNGSGKSTLLNLISGELKADAGDIRLSAQVHLIKLTTPLQDLNVQKYLTEKVHLDIDADKKLQLARDLADIFEFTFQLKQNLSQLSQGQKQKILMAGELINHPGIILLDEPFNHLDPFTRHEILQALFKYIKHQNISVVWVTHDRNEALKFSDQVALLNFGKLEQTGTPEKIMLTPKNLFVAQFMGQKNFLPISKLSEDSWSTPWGEWKHSSSLAEAYLVIPPHAWKLDPASAFKAKMTNQTLSHLTWEFEVAWSEKRYVVDVPHHLGQQLKSETELSLSPDFEECFLIPL